jgi:hypothetical protein
VLRHAPCPVVVVPRGTGEKTFGRLEVGRRVGGFRE